LQGSAATDLRRGDKFIPQSFSAIHHLLQQ